MNSELKSIKHASALSSASASQLVLIRPRILAEPYLLKRECAWGKPKPKTDSHAIRHGQPRTGSASAHSQSAKNCHAAFQKDLGRCRVQDILSQRGGSSMPSFSSRRADRHHNPSGAELSEELPEGPWLDLWGNEPPQTLRICPVKTGRCYSKPNDN